MLERAVKGWLVMAALALPLFAPMITPKAEAGASCIDVALVLAVDSSASVSLGEFALQRRGIAAAFRDEEVLQAIGLAGRVAVSVVFWGSEGQPKPQSSWVLIDSRQDAEHFARIVETMPREVTGDTGLGAGLLASLAKFAALDTCAHRKIVNVSGDGEETRARRGERRAPAPPQIRDLAQIEHVEINALAISNEEPNLTRYYSENVITGPDAFVMEVREYRDFSAALRLKLIREISPRVVS